MKKKKLGYEVLLIGGPFDGQRRNFKDPLGHSIVKYIAPWPGKIEAKHYRLYKFGDREDSRKLLAVLEGLELWDAYRIMFERYPTEIKYGW